MPGSGSGFSGYKCRWAWIDLNTRAVRIMPADADIYRDYVGGREVQARLIYDHLKSRSSLRNPLSPENRIVMGSSAANDTFLPTAGRGSCSFIGPMTRSDAPAPWVSGHKPVHGLITHSSCDGLFPIRSTLIAIS